MSYRIVYAAGLAVGKSKQYYNVYHSSEALQDINYTLQKGKIHATKITIYKIEEWERFSEKWVDRMDKAIEHASIDSRMLVQDNKIILYRNKK